MVSQGISLKATVFAAVGCCDTVASRRSTEVTGWCQLTDWGLGCALATRSQKLLPDGGLAVGLFLEFLLLHGGSSDRTRKTRGVTRHHALLLLVVLDHLAQGRPGLVAILDLVGAARQDLVDSQRRAHARSVIGTTGRLRQLLLQLLGLVQLVNKDEIVLDRVFVVLGDLVLLNLGFGEGGLVKAWRWGQGRPVHPVLGDVAAGAEH